MQKIVGSLSLPLSINQFITEFPFFFSYFFWLYSSLTSVRKPLESDGVTNMIRGGSKTPLLASSTVRDEDLPENKYKRRSAKEWLGRWMRYFHYTLERFM